MISVPANAEQKRHGGAGEQCASIEDFHDKTVNRYNEVDIEGSINGCTQRLRVAYTQRMKIASRVDFNEIWG